MKNSVLAAIIIAIVISACTTSRITSSWRDERISISKYKKIMVLGLIRETDRSIQQSMENHLVDDLHSLGYNAVSSLQEFGPKAFDKMEEEQAISKLKNSSIDAVLTIVMLDKKKESKYVPGHIYYSPYGLYYNHFWGYRTTLYHRIYEPGYYVTDTKYFWESNLYDMVTQKLAYSVQTQSFDPVNSESMAHEYGKMIINNMVKEHVLDNNGALTSTH
jgi:hypothetical protein